MEKLFEGIMETAGRQRLQMQALNYLERNTAEIAGCRPEACERIYESVAEKNANENFVCSILRHKLGLR